MGSTLFVITARGGSKGLPGKNIKPLRGKPLILYTIEAARTVAPDEDILVSTDSEEIKSIVEQVGLRVPFIRPAALATDVAGHHEILEHSVREMEKLRRIYEKLVLLQPTSPFRTGKHIAEALELFDENCDMVVSVKRSKDSPFFTQFLEDEGGFLVPCVERTGNRRQDSPPVYTYNGSTYVMRVDDIKRTHLHDLKRVRGYVMDDISSIDIDTNLDWLVAEAALDSELVG